IRIARACADLGIRSVAVFAEDDAASLHVRKADVALPLALPTVTLNLYWSRQADDEAGSLWLRGELAELATRLR
ncbi:biotin carboxylase N-terminal domain-containing protein, partial [Pseudomonas aeruginosa]